MNEKFPDIQVFCTSGSCYGEKMIADDKPYHHAKEKRYSQDYQCPVCLKFVNIDWFYKEGSE